MFCYSQPLVCMVTSFRTVGQRGSSPLHTTNMKQIVAKVYYDKAKKMYPNEIDKHRIFTAAIMIKLIMNSFYGKERLP